MAAKWACLPRSRGDFRISSGEYVLRGRAFIKEYGTPCGELGNVVACEVVVDYLKEPFDQVKADNNVMEAFR